MDEEANEGLGRRDLLKRGAMVGGAVLWTTPIVQSLASPAFAVATEAGGGCRYVFTGPTAGGGTVCGTFTSNDPASCRRFNEIYCENGQNALAAFFAYALERPTQAATEVDVQTCSGPGNVPACPVP
jgi:hypothetical protein